MTYDLAVIGAGPAGLAAAVTAAQAGLTVALIDAAERPGGQYFRHAPEAFHAARPGALHHGWAEFARLAEAVGTQARITCLPGHRVWTVEAGDAFTVHTLKGERESKPGRVGARGLVIATGAHDRSLPFPGWDLPGVLTAGGAQALLKGNLVRAGRRMVVAGTGPFLLPVATGLAAAGVRVAGVFEANRPAAFLRHPLPIARNIGKLAEGAGHAAALLAHRVPYRAGHGVVAAHGDRALEAVSVARLDHAWNPVRGSERLVVCDALAVGYGFTPQMEIPLQLGCATRVDADGSLVAQVDAAQRTSVPGVWAAGETTGVGGAELALAEGRLAALSAAGALDPAGATRRAPRRWPDHGGAGALVRRRARLRRFAAVLQQVHAVREGWAGWLRDDTLVCRCEEVPHDRLAEAVGDLGATDARTAKLISRAGMGWCQGRVCGYATTCLTALLTGTAPDPAGLAKRPIAQPIRLADLADLGEFSAGDDPA